MFESAEAMAFLPSEDLERSERFFRGVLDLPLVERTPFACVFRVADATLRVTKVDGLRPQLFTVFGWVVADIHSAVRELHIRGTDTLRYEGLDQDDDGVWTAPNGELVAWFHDPDANVLSVTEGPRRT